MEGSKKAAFAKGKGKNLQRQWKTYIIFCIHFQFEPLQATSEVISLYALFLKRSFKTVNAIQNYISGVRTMHTLSDVPCLLEGNVQVKLTLRGLARLNPHCPKQAAPLTPDILVKMYDNLEWERTQDVVFWALLLLAFFTSRKSNLVVTGGSPFDKTKHLCRSDVQIGRRGMLVSFRWSKTNQFGARILQVPVLAIEGSVLCPVMAFKRLLKCVPGEQDDPAFCVNVKGKNVLVTYYSLQALIKKQVGLLGLDPSLYSSHSLRRAGATWAFKAQVPGELIRTQGDWASEAYLRYIEFSLQERMEVARRMITEVQKM